MENWNVKGRGEEGNFERIGMEELAQLYRPQAAWFCSGLHYLPLLLTQNFVLMPQPVPDLLQMHHLNKLATNIVF